MIPLPFAHDPRSRAARRLFWRVALVTMLWLPPLLAFGCAR